MSTVSPTSTPANADGLNSFTSSAASPAALSTESFAEVGTFDPLEFPIIADLGQRRYGPPVDWTGAPPPRGCELFVGRIPKDITIEQLIPIFVKFGTIYNFRLKTDSEGYSKGYAFCIYEKKEHTKRAIKELDNYEIRKGQIIGVCRSIDNCRLFVGGIPINKTKDEIAAEMRKYTEGVKDVIAYPNIADKSRNRGFAFIEYENHKVAAVARTKLMAGRIQLWGHQIAVDWAEPEKEVNEEIMAQVKILYVRNLMLSTTEDTLRKMFAAACHDDHDCIERVKKIKDYAFIHFKQRQQAEKALSALNCTDIDGSKIEVTWAKPVDKLESGRQFNRSSRAGTITKVEDLASFAGNPSFNGTPTYFGATYPARPERIGRRTAAGSRSANAQRHRPHPIEILEDICQRMGCGKPFFSVVAVDYYNQFTGLKYQQYMGQVAVANFGICRTPQTCPTLLDAKTYAAVMMLFIMQNTNSIGITPGFGYSSTASAPYPYLVSSGQGLLASNGNPGQPLTPPGAGSPVAYYNMNPSTGVPIVINNAAGGAIAFGQQASLAPSEVCTVCNSQPQLVNGHL